MLSYSLLLRSFPVVTVTFSMPEVEAIDFTDPNYKCTVNGQGYIWQVLTLYVYVPTVCYAVILYSYVHVYVPTVRYAVILHSYVCVPTIRYAALVCMCAYSSLCSHTALVYMCAYS